MAKLLLLFSLCFSLSALAQRDSVLSGVYHWKSPAKNGAVLSTQILFEGKVHDMEWLQMSAVSLQPSGPSQAMQVPENEEHLLIIKEGQLNVSFNDHRSALGTGSVAVLMPGEKFSLQNKGLKPGQFFYLKYRSRHGNVKERGQKAGGSFVVDWNKTVYKPHDKGGRRDFFERPTAMSPRLEMHVSTLNQALKSHEPHTHRAEEMVLVVEGQTSMQIGNAFYNSKPGSIYYLGSDVLHAIKNEGRQPATYFAFQFE